MTVYLSPPPSHAHQRPLPIVRLQPSVSPAHQGTTVVIQPVLLSPLPAPAPALFVLLGLHVVMTALSNHAPRVNTHLKGSRHVKPVLMGLVVPIRLCPQSPSPQPPPPLPQIVQQRPQLNLQPHVRRLYSCRETNAPSQLNKIEGNISTSLH